ncbi:cobaltochelatase subunit CobN [Pseudofrankia inefficax]|uniref:Cobaltochelatase, CobN subunit n=1 Tax=Pseudofrankia inefficax (strain DSM 45817 / CECT 9037 / DDB 130130 / EuI1c) TaxID=298654 RepID=E3J9Z9_PSEI1|nr:cobaltochelatase subunit CobN [Pseudofrankia inefficax]ADP78561.1 cobaltochelatase, CobN subunit [Pseudofrankia inefficax]
MILLLSTSDTDLSCARACGEDYRLGNPARLDVADLPGLLDGVDVVVLRLLGGRRAWPEGVDALLARGLPVVVLSGELIPDAELMELSSVPAGVSAQAHAYLAHGGPDNLRQLARFLSDALLLTGLGFDPPVPTPAWGLRPRPDTAAPDERPTVAILYYRAHELAGNTAFVDALADAVDAAGGRAVPVFCASLRTADTELLAELGRAATLVTTVLAAGGAALGAIPAEVGAGGRDEDWDIGALAALDVPILQALAVTSSREQWEASDDGLSPLDTATQVAIPEFDGRIITVPFSFKEIDADGLSRYVPDPERAARVAGLAVRHARLRHVANADKRIALVLSAYPTKHARIGNAVGLDTPASVLALLGALREAGYDVGPETGPGALPGLEAGDGDAFIHGLIAAGGQDEDWLTAEHLAGNPVRVPAAVYRSWFATLPQDLRSAVEQHWGPAPGDLFVDHGTDPDGEIVLAAVTAGNVVILIQPPRGFGQNPIAIYHDPDLPPSHHYLAVYHWLRNGQDAAGFGAHAVVHVGKHGNLEWLPGKAAALSASCAPDAALGDLPLVYPFLVNDPGEGTQAKRRAHATVIDHLVPPMARADSYGDIARLERLLDEHAQIAAMDPAKLPAIRAQIWTLIEAAKLDHDLGLTNRPHDAEFDEFILHVDGWLCEIKDAQIRDGLHVLGAAPTGDARVNLVLSMLRARQLWGGAVALPGLRQALGLGSEEGTTRTDAVEAVARELLTELDDRDWDPAAVDEVVAEVLGVPAETDAIDRAPDDPDLVDRAAVAAVLTFAATEIVPRLARTTDEIDRTLHALAGGFIPAGPSGSPLRGLVNVLPTGRNFYAVDPRAVPSPLAWETGRAMADSLLARHLADTGEYPRSVGLSAWGTSAMRTSGDDVAEILALLGVTPLWDEASRRVRGVEPIPLAELGRPRIDVTVRISGFFRDAFPHVVDLLDDAIRLVADLDEAPEDNYVRAHADADAATHGDRRRATTRIFGSKPGAYGAGLLPLVDSGTWHDDADLAEVYAAWGGFAYGRGLAGRPARDDMTAAYRRISVAVKNTDSLEHDIADSDDYFQYHGGMIATVRALTGRGPRAYIGDSTRPDEVRTRTLGEEMARVVRARVVNPRWISSMRRHGYKGAFELAATVDYLFGYDATAGVVADWMYEAVTEAYVLDEENQKFLTDSNPWALHGIAERLLEAVDRGLWSAPRPETLDALREVYLRAEGDLEGRA